MISVGTVLFTTLFYIIKPTLMSTYYTAIDQTISELTLNSVQQYPIFRDLFHPITIEALYFIGFITIAFEITTLLILLPISLNKENNIRKFFYFSLFFIFFLSVLHLPYLYNIFKKTLTNKNIGYLIVQYEYYPLNEKCNNPKLIELGQTKRYLFKTISHNKVIYVEGIWDKSIRDEEKTPKNITRYKFHPFEEDCIKSK